MVAEVDLEQRRGKLHGLLHVTRVHIRDDCVTGLIKKEIVVDWVVVAVLGAVVVVELLFVQQCGVLRHVLLRKGGVRIQPKCCNRYNKLV